MQQFELNAELRKDVGKGASRRLRRTGTIPGIIYGTDKETTHITLDQAALKHRLEYEAFYSHILTVKVGNVREKVVLKDLQRHPFKPHIMHIDFQRIDEKEKLTMRIPLHFINESKCIGVKEQGGVISHVMSEIEITCLPRHLPEYIEVDMVEREVGDTIHLGDLSLPEGVEINALLHGGDPTRSVASVHLPRIEEEEEEEVVAEGEEVVEGEVEAAPSEPDSVQADGEE
ncbi:MAG: 50S ribosomal protein L25/general stress protein Ctc [Gammaproteobacteria bacterium]